MSPAADSLTENASVVEAHSQSGDVADLDTETLPCHTLPRRKPAGIRPLSARA
jgi:hypothetical protein